MSDTARPSARPRLLLVNHFALATVCGTTVLFGELLRHALRSVPEIEIAYESYEPYASPAALRARLDTAYRDASCVVMANAHIEVSWDLSEALFGWCRVRGLPAYDYVFDYWPHHEDNLRALTTRLGAHLVTSTPFLEESLRREGFASQLIEQGVPLPDTWPAAKAPASPKVIASAGRLVPRKRLPDVVHAFAESGLDGRARLYLMVAPSHVFTTEADEGQLREIRNEVERARLTGVTVDRRSGERADHDLGSTWYPDYAAYSVYVCASSYEGFGMPVVEAAFHGCPPLMSDIPPHRRSALILFGDRADDFLFPVGDCRALAALMRDEITSGRRQAHLAARIADVRATIVSRFSLAQTARGLARLACEVSA